MKRHKWEDTENILHHKSQKCVKCNIERSWLGGDMQCWEYFDPQSAIGSQRTTLNRPECEPKRGQTGGFYKNGEYIFY